MSIDPFLLRAAFAGAGVALAAAPLGCFVVWRRMAYFGDATAHAALLGVALALGFSLSILAGVLATALAMGLALWSLGDRGLAQDTLLGVLAHAALALALVAASLLPDTRLDLSAYLFGDILAVSWSDVGLIWTGAAIIAGLMVWRWQALLLATLSPDLAQADRIDPRREQLILTIALALAVAVALKVVGALLITAMLIVPAAAARPFARTPEAMAGLAAVLGLASVALGITASWQFDTPTGPTIVCAAAGLFALTAAVPRR
jgi:zinc transport system permease protein